jgi:alkanesulfonate monooxygenase SsuD/methylene tetrahydromethanopterin reductase-like flavin-dependent oxidoreductase (luciferase family)
MKASFFCTNSYTSPEALQHPGWPTPPRIYKPEIGARSVEVALEQARLADEAGFDWIACSEHHYMPALQTPNPNVFAAALSRVVRRARIAVLGPLVSMSNPVRVAEELAMLDQLTGGRLIALFLRGTPNEFLAYGVNPEETRARTQEASVLITRALSEPEPFGWEGRFFRFRTIAVWPGPIQRPHPPVFYSGNSIESATFAAANHFGLGMSYYPPHLVAQLANHYLQECAKVGWRPRPDQIIYRTFMGVAETDEEAAGLRSRFFGLEAIASMFRGRASVTGLAKPPSDQKRDLLAVLHPQGLRAPGEQMQAIRSARAAKELGTDANGKNTGADRGQAGFGFGGLQFCGSPDTVVKQIAEFHEQTGVGVLDVSFLGAGLTPEEAQRSFRLFTSEVLPRIRGIGAEPVVAPEASAAVK